MVSDLRHMRRPLLAWVVLVIVIGLLVPSAIGGALLLRSRYDEMIKGLHAEHRHLLDTLVVGMQNPLWNLDQQAGRSLMDAVMADNQVVNIVIRDSSGAIFLSAKQAPPNSGQRFVLQDAIYHEENHQRSRLGNVLIEVDSGVADASLARARIVYLATMAGQLLASVGLIIWLLNHSVLMPLRKLRAEAIELARCKLAKPFVWDRPDELGDLGASLESTRCELNVLFGEIEEKNRQLEDQNRELEQRVYDRTAELLRERDSLVEARRNIALLGEIGREITATFDPETILNKVYRHSSELMAVDVFGVGIYRADKGIVDARFTIERGQRREAYVRNMEDHNHIAGWCIEHRQPVLINDVANEIRNYVPLFDVQNEQALTRLADGSETRPTESLLFVPMVLKDRALGVIGVQSYRKHAYKQVHLDMLVTLGAYTAVALDNAEAYRQLQEAQAQLLVQEKMAVLGQLVAGVAHEINTPIAAVKSSGKNILDALDHALVSLPKVLEMLSETERELFIQLLDLSRQPSTVINSREERNISRELAQKLDALDIVDPRQRAGILVQLKANECYEQFLPLLRHPECLKILDAAYSISTVVMNAANINVAVERVAKIVFALKTFSRFAPEGEMTPSDLREGIEMVLTIYQNKIKQGTEIVRNYQEIPPVVCQPDELNQVWTNLIYNALQAMNYKGKLEIGICRAGDFAVVSIGDTGCGISKELKDRIFEPFFTTKPAGEGSGLGLDIVKKIVDRHKGRVEVDSTLGVGTTFHIYLPLEPRET